MTQNPLVQAVDTILAALKTFEQPFLTTHIRIVKPSVSLENKGERVELWFNTELVVSELNKISHCPQHHLTIPMAKCDIPTITAMVAGSIIHSTLNHANDIAYGKEGSAEEDVELNQIPDFVWEAGDKKKKSVWINLNSTLANACELFNNCGDTYIENLIKDPTVRIVRAVLSSTKHKVYGYPLHLLWSRKEGTNTHKATKQMWVPLGSFTDPHKLVTTVLVPNANKLFPANRMIDGSITPEPKDVQPIIKHRPVLALDSFMTAARDAIQIYNSTIAINVSESERVLFDVVDVRENGNSGGYMLFLKISQKGSDSFTRKIKLDKLEKYTGCTIIEDILRPVADYAQDPIMFKRLAKDSCVDEHRFSSTIRRGTPTL